MIRGAPPGRQRGLGCRNPGLPPWAILVRPLRGHCMEQPRFAPSCKGRGVRFIRPLRAIAWSSRASRQAAKAGGTILRPLRGAQAARTLSGYGLVLGVNGLLLAVSALAAPWTARWDRRGESPTVCAGGSAAAENLSITHARSVFLTRSLLRLDYSGG